MTIRVMVQYEDDWEVLSMQGDEDLQREFYEYDISDVLGLGGYTSDLGQFRSAVCSEYPLVPGMLVIAELSYYGEMVSTQEGTEYDAHWETDQFVVIYPKGKIAGLTPQEYYALQTCEEVITRGGFCSRCYSTLIGTNWYARKFALCDRCAKEQWHRDIEIARDPLYLLRQSARFSMGRCHDGWGSEGIRKKLEAEIQLMDEPTLRLSISRWDEEFHQWLSQWQMYQ